MLPKILPIKVHITTRRNPQEKIFSDLMAKKPEPRIYSFIIWALGSCILWALIICSSSLGRWEAQSQINISSISVVRMWETFYRTAGWRECSSSTLLDLIKLLSKEAVTKWPRTPISPCPHRHWIWSRCSISAKIRSWSGCLFTLHLPSSSEASFRVFISLEVNSLCKLPVESL